MNEQGQLARRHGNYPADESPSLHEYFAVVRRRKLIALIAILLVPAAAFYYSHQQEKRYQASAQVLLNSQNLANELTGTQGTPVDPARLAQTQADVARVSAVAQQVLRHVHGTGLTPAGLLADSEVSASASSDILTFTVTNHVPLLASRLVNAYARAYTVYRRQLDTAAINDALTGVNALIAQLATNGDRGSALYASLVNRKQTLQTMEALQTSNVSVIQTASSASQTEPRTTRNTVLGVVLGLVLGLGLAFLYEALDTRVRSAEDVTRGLRLPLLARIPTPPRALRSEDRLVMIAEPTSPGAEPSRVLRANLEIVNFEAKTRTIVVTSALPGEGKSTTAANLAIALARAGRHAILVDLDLRRPYLGRFLGIQDRPGVVDVALGRVALEEALVPVPLTATASTRPAVQENGRAMSGGLLEVLTAGVMPPNPDEFSGSPIVAGIIASLSKRAPFVIIDSAPLLGVGDTLALSQAVEGMVIVARLNRLRKPMLSEVKRLIDGTPVKVLGFVLTGADAEDTYGYAHYEYIHKRPSGRWPFGRREEAPPLAPTPEGKR